MTETDVEFLLAQLPTIVRAMGYDLFVLPSHASGAVSGLAFTCPDRRQRINLYGFDRTPEWTMVLLHEIEHHRLGHTTVWTTIPLWQKEDAADEAALQFCSRLFPPEVMARLEQAAKDNVRRYLQPMIDDAIVHHVDLGIADWAGCIVPVWMRAELIEPSDRRMDDEGMVF